jgi:hypothetical protein
MKRLMILFAATAVLAACGSAAANDREVASLSTTPTGEATTGTGTGDTSGDATGTTAVVDPTDAPLKFAKCMREHGIDMPDPTIGAGGEVTMQIGGPPGGANDPGNAPDPKEVDAANKACQHFMDDASKSFDPPSAEEQKKMQESALAFAKCMRDHGVDMPDPTFSDTGAFSISVGAGPNGSAPTNNGPLVDFNSDEFKAANEACGGPDGGGFVVSADPAGG